MARLATDRLHAAKVIARCELRSTFYGSGIYIATFAAFVFSALILRNYLGSVDENGLVVMANPLNVPLYFSVVITSVYLAMSSAIAIARERDLKTLEVLFYGPVDPVSYIFGKYVEQLMVYMVIAVVYAVYFFTASFVTNFGVSASFFAVLLMSVFMASTMVSFGILLSTWARKTKTAILLLIGFVVLFLALQFAYDLLAGIEPTGLPTPLAYARTVFAWLAGAVSWISPFAYLSRGIEAVEVGKTGLYLLSLVFSVAYSAVLLVAAVVSFARRGIRS